MRIKKYGYSIVENRIYLINFSFFKILFSDEIMRFLYKIATIHNIYSLLKYSMELHSYYVFHHTV